MFRFGRTFTRPLSWWFISCPAIFRLCVRVRTLHCGRIVAPVSRAVIAFPAVCFVCVSRAARSVPCVTRWWLYLCPIPYVLCRVPLSMPCVTRGGYTCVSRCVFCVACLFRVTRVVPCVRVPRRHRVCVSRTVPSPCVRARRLRTRCCSTPQWVTASSDVGPRRRPGSRLSTHGQTEDRRTKVHIATGWEGGRTDPHMLPMPTRL